MQRPLILFKFSAYPIHSYHLKRLRILIGLKNYQPVYFLCQESLLQVDCDQVGPGVLASASMTCLYLFVISLVQVYWSHTCWKQSFHIKDSPASFMWNNILTKLTLQWRLRSMHTGFDLPFSSWIWRLRCNAIWNVQNIILTRCSESSPTHRLFGDDTIIFRKINNLEDNRLLQEDLTALEAHQMHSHQNTAKQI